MYHHTHEDILGQKNHGQSSMQYCSFKVIKRSSSSDMVQKDTQVIPFSFCRARIHHPANLRSLLSLKPLFLYSISSIIFWRFSVQETINGSKLFIQRHSVNMDFCDYSQLITLHRSSLSLYVTICIPG
jgi:hypothetical protein